VTTVETLVTRHRSCHRIRCRSKSAESSLVDAPEAAVMTLNALRRAGVRVGIDDFGTGHVLGHVRRVPFDSMKLDRALMADHLHRSVGAGRHAQPCSRWRARCASAQCATDRGCRDGADAAGAGLR
jgi:EAL domain-containing protein (putative c-di-GMP-specific phosphodiesterase class I)